MEIWSTNRQPSLETFAIYPNVNIGIPQSILLDPFYLQFVSVPLLES